MNFKAFLEDAETDEITPEELAADAQAKNQAMKVTDAPESLQWIDPDDFYNKDGIFTFFYSPRWLEPPLYIGWAKKSHKQMMRDKEMEPNGAAYAGQMIAGRYGFVPLRDGVVPIVTFWTNNYPNLIKSALMAMWSQRLIHPESYMFMGGDNKGKIKEMITAGIPDNFRQAADQKVDIGGRKYSISELPAFLHSLPAASQEHKEIVAFICANKDKYPILKGIGYKLKCIPQETPAPKMTLQQRYLFQSESYEL
jgi:hypothetical protein